MFSLKTKYAAFGAAIAISMTAVFLGGVAWVFGFHVSAGPLPLIVLVAAIVATIGSASLAFVYGRRLSLALDALKHGATRITQGDYTLAMETARRDELGDLQRALEQMRQRLRQTTISKNYLGSVLNSMSDAVFVTASTGAIKIANTAACRLSGYAEPTLIGRSIGSLLAAEGQVGEDAVRDAREAGEGVLRTESGQTIPVSFTGSDIETDDPQFAGSIFVARDITDRKRAERRIRYLARYDALTKIPNRMQFQHLLQQAIARNLRGGTSVALLYLDMDHFKEVNDTFGHGAGDRVLEVMTERLTRALPPDTVIGRLAGDEFALFIDSLPQDAGTEDAVKSLAREILIAVSQAFHVNQQEVFLSASIGVAICPTDAENVIDLIRNADAAMYYSKQNGGNSCVFYSSDMNAAAVERLMLKSKLKRALEREEFFVRYMPKVDLITGRIVGAEALLRWRVPGHGDIPPSQFIPLAEENNLILPIGEWVLNRVCADYRRMTDAGRHPGRVSLNLSLKQLRQASFMLHCRSVFEKHGVSPQNLELEITETTLMADPKRTIGMLKEINALGVHLSIDDFGTGYSSLSALQQFPIGSLKVDQSFVRNAARGSSDATLVRTIVEMGRTLGLLVVAEGVETLEQLDFLRKTNCHYGQGQLFGEPCTAEELGLLLKQQEDGRSPFAGFFPSAPAKGNIPALRA